MTEDEAKTKWCPFARTIAVAGTLPDPVWTTLARNRVAIDGSMDLQGSRCIASACMAWRWLDKREMRWTGLNNPPEGEGWERVENLNGPGYWLRHEQTPTGRCGLAGQ